MLWKVVTVHRWMKYVTFLSDLLLNYPVCQTCCKCMHGIGQSLEALYSIQQYACMQYAK